MSPWCAKPIIHCYVIIAARPSFRGAHAAQESRVHPGRDDYPGAWDRREHGHLHRHKRAAAAAFSATALVLAIIGLYGVLAYTVAQRRQELGIRLALGAERSDILRLVVKQGIVLAGAGIVLGIVVAGALSLALTRVPSGMLYKISTHDFLTFAVAPLAFLAIALLASYLPAHRATKVDPTEALRQI